MTEDAFPSVVPRDRCARDAIAQDVCAILLAALADGSSRPAGELARAVRMTTQAVRPILDRSVTDGLMACETFGPHRYYRLASGSRPAPRPSAGPDSGASTRHLSGEARRLRPARYCHGHLAGLAGVALAQALQAHGYLATTTDRRFDVTPAGLAWFRDMGLDVGAIRPTPRGLAYPCLDWTERQYHLAGPLGVQFTALLCAKGWLQPSGSPRGLQITALGRAGLQARLGIAPGGA